MKGDAVTSVIMILAHTLAPVIQVMNYMHIPTLTTLAWQMEKQGQERGIK